MTRLVELNAKEMTRETGFKNALGYSDPENDRILIRKGLNAKQRRNVLQHEEDHMMKGEEGPMFGVTGGMGGGGGGGAGGAGAFGVAGAIADWAGATAAKNTIGAYEERGEQQYIPYSQLGREQVNSLRNWLASPEGAWGAPTMEQIQSSPGYAARLSAIENSAAARGGLLSGNALRNIGEFGASEYDRYMGRKRRELMDRLGIVQGVGLPAAGGMAQHYQYWGPLEAGAYQKEQERFGDIARSMGSAMGGF